MNDPGDAGEVAPGPAIGAGFAGHRVEAVIGRGGMGVVYRARNLALDRERALKVLAPALSRDERFRERFRRESRLAASIEHPNVIPIHEAGEEEGQLYISMRLVEGDDLRALVDAEGPLDPAAAVGIVSEIAAALDAAHDAGLIHRDVKPANVLVGSGADAGRVYLTDFGISRTARAGETVTATGEIVGTADFIAPEQIAGEAVDARADVYALGAVLHYALTGQAPFPRENELATLFAHANAPRPRPSEVRPGVPVGLDAVVAKAMAVRPEDRYASAGELGAALTGALGAAGETPTLPLAEPADHGSRRLAIVAAVAGVAAAVVAVVLVLAGGSGSDVDGATETTRSAPARAATIEVGTGPIGVTVGPDRVWVAVRGADEVAGIDPATDEPVSPPASIPTPSSVAVGFGSVWAVSSETNSLYRFDPDAPGGPQSFPIGLNPSDVAVDERWVWVTVEGENRVVRFDPGQNAPTGEVAVGAGPRAVATGEGAVWVTNVDGESISKVDPEEVRRVGSDVVIQGSRPSDIAVGGGSVWAVDNLGGRLIHIDPGPADEPPALSGDPLPGFNRPRGVKVGFGAVWVVSGGDSSLLRIDQLTGLTDEVRVGREPADLAIGADAIWTADEDGGSVTRVDPGQSPFP